LCRLAVIKWITFMKNSYFAEEYEAMPTELLKGYEILSWGFSIKDAGCGRCAELLQIVEKGFTREEWEYLIKLTPNITAKIEYSKRLKAKFGC